MTEFWDLLKDVYLRCLLRNLSDKCFSLHDFKGYITWQADVAKMTRWYASGLVILWNKGFVFFLFLLNCREKNAKKTACYEFFIFLASNMTRWKKNASSPYSPVLFCVILEASVIIDSSFVFLNPCLLWSLRLFQVSQQLLEWSSLWEPIASEVVELHIDFYQFLSSSHSPSFYLA